MAQNVIVAEDGSLIPTGDTQVEQVGEAASGAEDAGDRTDLIVGGADPSDTFALPDGQVFDSGEVVDEDAVDAGVATPTDTGGGTVTDTPSTTTDTPPSASDGVGESVRQVIIPSQSSGSLPTGLLTAGLAVVAVIVALLGGGE
ncbi:hypothetical protein [Haloplanus pelagicus]|jgi:hypothetical protein|uniref:hypothetical protein n=1 Tax=Haloplanus pelagicus TaxID=2949995 RepID=UPI0020400F83|nr:hypothetical protein [Haloplanus sp. HW8-1]